MDHHDEAAPRLRRRTNRTTSAQEVHVDVALRCTTDCFVPRDAVGGASSHLYPKLHQLLHRRPATARVNCTGRCTLTCRRGECNPKYTPERLGDVGRGRMICRCRCGAGSRNPAGQSSRHLTLSADGGGRRRRHLGRGTTVRMRESAVQQPVAAWRVRHASAMRAGVRDVTLLRKVCRGIVWMLSKLTTLSVGTPSTCFSWSSETRPRRVRVRAATTTEPMRSATGSGRGQAGRRLA